MDEPLNADEQKLVEKYYPLLEQTARKHRKKLPLNEATSIAYDGLVKAIRTWDREQGGLDRWIEHCCFNAIRDARKQEARRTAQHVQLSYEPVDHRETEQSPLYAAIAELPDYLQESIQAYIEANGNHREAARIVGCSVAELKDDLAIARDKIRDLF